MTEQVYREEQQQSSWGSFWESFAALFQKQEQTYVPQVQQVLEQKRGSVLKAVYAPQIEVYYWGPAIQNGQLGHLALRIIDDDEDIYISHWPRKWYKFIMSESAQKSSFLFDVEDEGRGPDEYVHIPDHMINVKSVKKWWTQFLKDARKGSEYYDLLFENCAQVVYKALRVGSFPHYILLYPPMISPGGVTEWVKSYHGVTFKKGQ